MSTPRRGHGTRRLTFSGSNLSAPYHSVNTDINKRIRHL